MKKILILANLDIGLYKFRKELIRELLRRGNRVLISLPDGDLVRPLEKMGCIFINTPIDRRGMNPKTDVKLIESYRKILKKIQPDLVITYTIKPNIYGGMICRVKKIPYATMITGLGTAFQKKGALKHIVTFLYKRALKKADKVFFENKENRRVFLKNRIIKKEKTVLLAGAGVNLKEYPFTVYPTENNGIHFLFIGRIMKEKGIDELFWAAEELKKKYSSIYFDIIGFDAEEYRDKILALEQEKIITFHGYQEDVRPFIAKAHCFVLPSYHEGMANTLLECAAMGRPLITSNIPGCREAVWMGGSKDQKEKTSESHPTEECNEEAKTSIQIGNNGILCKPQDTESLREAIEHFLSLNYPIHREMGKYSRLWMEKRFDKRKVVEKTVKELGV